MKKKNRRNRSFWVLFLAALRNRKENKNETRLITIQQYKSQKAKNPDGKLKNKDEIY